MHPKIETIRERLLEMRDLQAAAAVLSWDQLTYMPPGGTAARSHALATLRRLHHERFTDPAFGALLDALRPVEDSSPYDSFEASLIRVTRREYERAVRVPASFVAEFTRHKAETYEAWTRARPANDFASVRPYLERTVEMSRQLAHFFPGFEHVLDPLIDFSDYGARASVLRRLFDALRARLAPLAAAILVRSRPDDGCLKRRYPEETQVAFARDVIGRLGFDFRRGRQDLSAHPFMTSFSPGDVRITIRIKEADLGEALFSMLHEAGHALYEQGIPTELDGTPLGHGTSSGVHESQSRLWENIVGRSRAFWTFFYPRLVDAFPGRLGRTGLDEFCRAINKVERTLIRTDADEVTYNLHVMMRFDFESALLEGKLAVRDLPAAWRERFRADFGIVPPDDREGVLQDMHWFGGKVGGAFQGYTLGNLIASQLYEAALRARPEIPVEMEHGRFDTLLGWLRENVHRHGSKLTADEVVAAATGEPLSIEPYLRYLGRKYGELYGL